MKSSAKHVLYLLIVITTKSVSNIAFGIVALALAAPAIAHESAAANDLEGFAVMQAKFEEVRNNGKFTSATLHGELAYYYSVRVPLPGETKTKISKSGDEREVTTKLTDCRETPGFPANPKFLYGGLDPYALIGWVEKDRLAHPDLDAPYANFFPVLRNHLGVCDNFSVLDIPTGPGRTTQYVVLFESEDNKRRFDEGRLAGTAPMPAAGFWCMWGLGGYPVFGDRPFSYSHFAAPNNPQFALYQLDPDTVDSSGLESTTYIGANFWLRAHGMGSPWELGGLTTFLETLDSGDITADDMATLPFRLLRPGSVIFHNPLDPR